MGDRDSEMLRWLGLNITFIYHVDTAPEPHNYGNEFQGLRNASSYLHQVSLFKINMELIWEEKQNTQSLVVNDEHHWAKACLCFHPSFICFGLCRLFNYTAFREPVCEPWLHLPLPHRPRLCLVNWTSSYNETKTLKPWVLKSAGKILWSTWVGGAVEGNPGDMFPRKQIQASPLVWAVHEPVKVFLPGKVLPWLMFQQKGMISFVSECRITVNCALTTTGGGIC